MDKETSYRLTQQVKIHGWSCKLGPNKLSELLTNVGLTGEIQDAAVINVPNSDLVLVKNIDIFTPIVDEPKISGEIAACNVTNDIFALNVPEISGKLVDDICDEFDFSLGFKINKSDVERFVKNIIDGNKTTTYDTSYDTSIYKGEYVVKNARMTGGSHGRDSYPDGWCVTCKKLKNEAWDKDGLVVSFYQSGCFTAMIEDIEPIRRLEMSFS